MRCDPVSGDQRADRGLPEHQRRAFLRVIGVHRHIGGARVQGAQDRDVQIRDPDGIRIPTRPRAAPRRRAAGGGARTTASSSR